MGEFNSDDHYIYYYGQESLRRNGVTVIVNRSLKCSTSVQSQKQQNDLCLSPRQTIQYHSNSGGSQTSIQSSRKKIKPCLYYFSLSCVQLFVTPWTVARQTPLSMGMLQARILEWAAFCFPGDRPDPGIKPGSPALRADSLFYHLSHQGIFTYHCQVSCPISFNIFTQ